jgi:hypothetical protein
MPRSRRSSGLVAAPFIASLVCLFACATEPDAGAEPSSEPPTVETLADEDQLIGGPGKCESDKDCCPNGNRTPCFLVCSHEVCS